MCEQYFTAVRQLCSLIGPKVQYMTLLVKHEDIVFNGRMGPTLIIIRPGPTNSCDRA